MLIKIAVFNGFESFRQQKRNLFRGQDDTILAVARKKTADDGWLKTYQWHFACLVRNSVDAVTCEGDLNDLCGAGLLHEAKGSEMNVQLTVVQPEATGCAKIRLVPVA